MERSEDLAYWAVDEGAALSWAEGIPKFSVELASDSAAFFRVQFEHLYDYSPRVVPRYEGAPPVTPAAAYVRAVDAFQPEPAAQQRYQEALVKAEVEQRDTVPGYYRCRFSEDMLPFLVRFELGDSRVPVNEWGHRLQLLSEAMVRWGTLGNLFHGGFLDWRDLDAFVSPPLGVFRAEVESRGEGYSVLVPKCEPVASLVEHSDKKTIVYFPSAGELIAIGEEDLSFVAWLPDDLRDWLKGCSNIVDVEPLTLEF